jgi:hypothetical protein
MREVLRREGIKDSDLVHWIKSITCVPGLNDTSIFSFFFLSVSLLLRLLFYSSFCYPKLWIKNIP